MRFFRWLRTNSQKYLLEASQKDLAVRHGLRGPVTKLTPQVVFWKFIFVPLYRLLPWPLRHKIMGAMPGSHRKEWSLPPS